MYDVKLHMSVCYFLRTRPAYLRECLCLLHDYETAWKLDTDLDHDWHLNEVKSTTTVNFERFHIVHNDRELAVLEDHDIRKLFDNVCNDA